MRERSAGMKGNGQCDGQVTEKIHKNEQQRRIKNSNSNSDSENSQNQN